MFILYYLILIILVLLNKLLSFDISELLLLSMLLIVYLELKEINFLLIDKNNG